MPWLETAPMEQRERFIRDHRLALYNMVELSARYGISRKTGYKWLGRFDQGGREGLGDRSRAPHRCPHKISDEVATLICEARRRHPSWGPDKLLDWLGPRHPAADLPAVSTAGDLLARKGLVKKRRRRRHYQHPGVVPIKTVHPNDLWTADFKGHFRTRDGVYCYPLTVADQHTRYLLACHGLSQLNVWWLRLGIQHQRSRPASPQDNGAHERMHKTLKAEAIRPPRATLAPQQRAFNRFRAEYNDERPHQFLKGATPASRYRTSPRLYSGTLPPIEYPGHFIVKRITNAGTFRFKKRLLFIANALKQHAIGLEEVDDGIWSIHFCRVLLGRVDERDYIIRG